MLIALVGQKGGTGKTTLAVSLASAAAHRGHRTMIVDADPRGDARVWASFADHREPPTVGLPLDVGSHQLRALALGMDMTFVDCPSGDAARLAAIADACDLCLVPCTPSPMDVWSLGTTFDILREARAHNPRLGAGIVVNQADASTTLSKIIAPQLREQGFPVFNTAIRRRVAIGESVGCGLSVSGALPDSAAAHEIEALFDEVRELSQTHQVSAHPLQ